MKLTKLAVATLFAASVVPFSSMADSNSGTITFLGSVVSTPCNIAQESLDQKVDFGQLSRSSLEKGVVEQKKFQIKFTGCDFDNFVKSSGGASEAVKHMKLTFTGQYYADLGKTMLQTSPSNDNNLGIMIDGFTFGTETDVLDRIANKVGDNSLEFTALAKRVDASAPVAEGKFDAISNFRITYD